MLIDHINYKHYISYICGAFSSLPWRMRRSKNPVDCFIWPFACSIGIRRRARPSHCRLRAATAASRRVFSGPLPTPQAAAAPSPPVVVVGVPRFPTRPPRLLPRVKFNGSAGKPLPPSLRAIAPVPAAAGSPLESSFDDDAADAETERCRPSSSRALPSSPPTFRTGDIGGRALTVPPSLPLPLPSTAVVVTLYPPPSYPPPAAVFGVVVEDLELLLLLLLLLPRLGAAPGGRRGAASAAACASLSVVLDSAFRFPSPVLLVVDAVVVVRTLPPPPRGRRLLLLLAPVVLQVRGQIDEFPGAGDPPGTARIRSSIMSNLIASRRSLLSANILL